MFLLQLSPSSKMTRAMLHM